MFRLSAKSGDRVSVAPFWVVACCLALASCEGGKLPAGPARDQETGHLSVSINLGKVAAASISRAEILVTGSGTAEVRQDLTVSGDTVTGTITDIPAGPDRLFTLNGYDASGILTYTGSATATVIAGQQVTVRITVRGVASAGKPVLQILPSLFVDRSVGAFVTGEISNSGTVDATGVVISFRARDVVGAPIQDLIVNVGTIVAGGSTLFEARFASKKTYSVDYTISYNEGTSVKGSIVIP